MKILLFGDGPTLKEKGKALREQHGCAVHLRSIRRWAGDVEQASAVYFMERAEPVRAAYAARGIECLLIEEAVDDASAPSETASEPLTPPLEPQTPNGDAGPAETPGGQNGGRRGGRRGV